MTETTNLARLEIERELALTEAMLLPAALRELRSAGRRRTGAPGACC
jgi:hypothetical protein